MKPASNAEGATYTPFSSMLENGVYVAPSAFEAGFISAAHTFEDIDATVEAARKALKQAAK